MKIHIDAREQLLAGLPVVERRVRLAGMPTALLEGGDGPPVVLLPGPGGSAFHWIGVIPALVTTHHVVAPDMPGQGASDTGGATLTVDSVLGWLGELIDKACETPPVLVGYASGAAIAARFAADQGYRLDRMVLVSALGLTGFDPAPDFARALNDFVARPAGDTHTRLWQQCTHDFDQVQRRMGNLWQAFETYNLDGARNPNAQKAFNTVMELFVIPAIPAADLARIAVPTALIWGRHDQATPLRVAQGASARYGWPLQVIDDVAGDPHLEDPERFLRALHAALGGAAV
jgi:pimeloyl-ACP methyl ester carboxylesterase